MKKSETSQLFRMINIRILNVVFDDRRGEKSQAHWRLSIYVTLFKHAPWSSSRLLHPLLLSLFSFHVLCALQIVCFILNTCTRAVVYFSISNQTSDFEFKV